MKSIPSNLLFVLIYSAAVAQPQGGREYAGAIQKARAYITDSLQRCNVPGASVAVAKNGKIVWSEGFGLASLELNAPATPQTKFRTGSVAKSLTAGLMGLLVQEGKLNLDAEVHTYVPYYPKTKYPFTVRQVAGHLAGIRHYRGEEFLSQKRYNTVREGLKVFEDDSLLFQPGTKYSYSSYGFNLLSAALEGASGGEFLSLMRDRIFKPLGMSNTVPEYPDSIIPNRSEFYSLDRNNVETNAPMVDNSYKWAGGGFLTTSEDLVRYGNAYLDTLFLKSAVLRTLAESQKTSDGNPTNYSMGWFVTRDGKNRLIMTHGGLGIGGTATLWIVPEEKLVLAMLANNDSNFTRCARRILEMFVAP